MKTAKEREAEFRADLAELLRKHRAELNVTDDGRPYGMQSGVCEVYLEGVFDEDGNVIEEFSEFNL